MVKNLPNFDHEQFLWKQGFHLVAGVDEVGRGAWAGPVVASAVAFAPPISNFQFPISNEFQINDSKQMKPKERELAAVWIKENALAWAVGEVGVATINRIGIGKATAIAMRRAIGGCNNRLQTTVYGLQSTVDFLLIDAFYIPYVRGIRHNHQTSIIKGDQKSFSIAAASIIAKVYRDSLMTSLSKQFKFKDYKWDKNKGYGTKEHQNEILRNGLTYLHRIQFVETWRSKLQ